MRPITYDLAPFPFPGPGVGAVTMITRVRSNARRQSRRPRQSQLLVEKTADASSQPETRALNSADEQWWRDELGYLPAHQRTAVVLRYVGELSYAEIATATKRPIGSVKSDVHRGLAVLANRLKGKVPS